MAAIVLEIGKKKIETDATDVDIGTRPSCLAPINDPVAAAVHAWIRRRGGLFFVEDAGSSSGTWKNGQAVTRVEPLSDGDVLVVGCTRIQVRVTPGDPAPQLVLSFRETSVYFEPSKKHQVTIGGQEMTVVSGDAERWVRDEVAFGRWRALAGVNGIALVAGIALLTLVAFDSTGRRFVQPGELQARHAALFAADAPHHGGAASAAVLAASVEGCSACHDPFGGTPVSKCEVCHEDLVRDRHPFALEAGPGMLASGIVVEDDVCSSCHADHQGREPAHGTFVPAPAAVAASCTACHADPPPRADARRLQSVPTEMRRIAYDAFPHVKHAQVACEVCHAPARAPDAVAVADRDFAAVGFATCIGCHASDDPRSKFRRDPSLADRAAPVTPEHRVSLAWHGSRAEDGAVSRCLACHPAVFEGDLRQVQTHDVEPLTVQARRRGHHELFADHVSVVDAAGRTRACVECHVAGEPWRAGEVYTDSFRHAQHVAVLEPPDAAAARVSSADCAACHGELSSSFHLVGRPGPATDHVVPAPGYLGPEIQSCAGCHTDENGALLVARIEPQAGGALALRTDFPHALHASTESPALEQGCFACHAFEAGGDARLARPITPDPRAATSCLPCHETHANVGGSGCAMCHPDTAGGQADIAYLGPHTSDERAFVARARTSAFSHGTRGHDGGEGGCLACHTGADAAATIRDVHVPDESDASCWKCHVEDRQQFHWRGSPGASRSPAPPR